MTDPQYDSSNTGLPLPVAAIAALQKGDKIEAIKIVRQERNIGLKEAKEAVDLYLANQPALRAALAAKQAKSRGALLRWLVVVALLGVLFHYLLAPR